MNRNLTSSVISPGATNSRRYNTCATPLFQPLSNQHLQAPLVSEDPKPLTGAKSRPQLPQNQHLRSPLASVASKGFITPADATPTHMTPPNSFISNTYRNNRGEVSLPAPPLPKTEGSSITPHPVGPVRIHRHALSRIADHVPLPPANLSDRPFPQPGRSTSPLPFPCQLLAIDSQPFPSRSSGLTLPDSPAYTAHQGPPRRFFLRTPAFFRRGLVSQNGQG
jgi:hypothetical protein